MGSTMTIGLASNSTSSLVQYNTIRGGGGAESVGILIQGGNGTYDANTISGGSGATAIGIRVAASGSNTFTNNLISGCGRYGGASPTDCTAVQIEPVTGTTVVNNTINGGSASTSSTGIKDRGTGSRISSNLVFTSARGVYCVWEFNSANTGYAFQNNNLFDCGGTLSTHYYDNTRAAPVDLTTLINIGGVVGMSLASQFNVFDLPPQFVSSGSDPGQVDAADVDWHLRDTSPAEVRSGSVPCNFPNKDREGKLRGYDSLINTTSSSMGAYRSPTQNNTGYGAACVF